MYKAYHKISRLVTSSCGCTNPETSFGFEPKLVAF